MKTPLPAMSLPACLSAVAMAADQLANTLEPGAPSAAVEVLNDLDKIGSLPATLAAMIEHAAVAKIWFAAGYMRRNFGRFSLGEETADTLDAAAVRIEQLINEAGL